MLDLGKLHRAISSEIANSRNIGMETVIQMWNKCVESKNLPKTDIIYNLDPSKLVDMFDNDLSKFIAGTFDGSMLNPFNQYYHFDENGLMVGFESVFADYGSPFDSILLVDWLLSDVGLLSSDGGNLQGFADKFNIDWKTFEYGYVERVQPNIKIGQRWFDSDKSCIVNIVHIEDDADIEFPVRVLTSTDDWDEWALDNYPLAFFEKAKLMKDGQTLEDMLV